MKHRRLLSYILCFIALAAICFITCINSDFLKASAVDSGAAEPNGEYNAETPDGDNSSDGDNSASEDVTEEIVSSVCGMSVLDVPIICINTTDRVAVVSDSEYIDCKVAVIDDGKYEMEGVTAVIRTRGNTSKGADKKSYRLKFDKKRSMFGSDYKAKSWNLIANYYDKSLSRNMIAYTLSERFENIDFTSAYTYVEVFLNDEYMGVYGFCDKIGTGEGRVDISENNTIAGGGISYLITINAHLKEHEKGINDDEYFVFDGLPYEVKSPDLEETDNIVEYLAAIQNSVEECYNAITSGDYEAACKYVDVESFAETYIINELFANNDVCWASCYFYKDVGGKLTSGPVWDYDIAAGNTNYNYGTATEFSPYVSLTAKEQSKWYSALLEMSEFEVLVKEKLACYKDVILETIELANPENESGIYAKYGQAMERNFEKWQIMGKYVWPEPQNVYEIDTVTGQLSFLENWLTERYYFVCNQYGVEL